MIINDFKTETEAKDYENKIFEAIGKPLFLINIVDQNSKWKNPKPVFEKVELEGATEC